MVNNNEVGAPPVVGHVTNEVPAVETTPQVVQAEAVVQVEQKTNKSNRAWRTAAQALVAFLASGTLLVVWNSIVSSAQIDPVVVAALSPILIWVVSYAQNAAEDAGMSIPGLTAGKFDEVKMVVEDKSVTPAPDTQVNN